MITRWWKQTTEDHILQKEPVNLTFHMSMKSSVEVGVDQLKYRIYYLFIIFFNFLLLSEWTVYFCLDHWYSLKRISIVVHAENRSIPFLGHVELSQHALFIRTDIVNVAHIFMYYRAWNHSWALKLYYHVQVTGRPCTFWEDHLLKNQWLWSILSVARFLSIHPWFSGVCSSTPFSFLRIAEPSSAWVTYSQSHSCWQWTGRAFTLWHISNISGWHSQTLMQRSVLNHDSLKTHIVVW